MHMCTSVLFCFLGSTISAYIRVFHSEVIMMSLQMLMNINPELVSGVTCDVTRI
jgi:hypothetical protein